MKSRAAFESVEGLAPGLPVRLAPLVLLLLGSCRREVGEDERARELEVKLRAPRDTLAPNGSAAASTSVPPTPVPAASAPLPPDPREVERARLTRYSHLFTEPDLLDCKTYGIFLRIGPATRQSSRAWLAETFRAEPLYSKALDEGALQVSDYIYGNHYFADVSANRYATIIHCEDHLLCRAFAGLYGRVDVEAKPKAFCEPGTPGSSSGNFFSKKRLFETARSHPHGTCGRYRACLAAENRPAESCDGFEVSARKCAEEASCADARLLREGTPKPETPPLAG